MNATDERVVIGMDPHKRSVTIEVMAADEEVLGGEEALDLVLCGGGCGCAEVALGDAVAFCVEDEGFADDDAVDDGNSGAKLHGGSLRG